MMRADQLLADFEWQMEKEGILVTERDKRCFLMGAAKAAEHLSPIPPNIALNIRHPDCHKAADAFWTYWKENGETHKHGYYESTWGAINRAIRMVGVVRHDYEIAATKGAAKP